MNEWWDHGKYEGIDNDTTPLVFEPPYTLRTVEWVIEDEDARRATEITQ